MLPDYADIRDRLGEPIWWDGNGVPRYDPFRPDMLGVYDTFALYVEIECQSCAERFLVGEGRSRLDLMSPFTAPPETFLTWATGYHYGDPPAHTHPRHPGGLCGGTSMNVIDRRIVEAWERVFRDRVGYEWVRHPEIETIDVTPEWIKDEGGEL